MSTGKHTTIEPVHYESGYSHFQPYPQPPGVIFLGWAILSLDWVLGMCFVNSALGTVFTIGEDSERCNTLEDAISMVREIRY